MENIKLIYTLDARDNVLLKVIRDHFDMSNVDIQNQVQSMRQALESELRSKGIDYNDLRSVLVPNQERKEVVFVFDRLQINSSWYGYDVFEKLIPLFGRDTKHSILSGDYLDVFIRDQESLKQIMLQQMSLKKEINFVRSNQFYVVYINNISQGEIERMNKSLSDWEPYVGYADMTYSSNFKHLLSGMLVNTFIKYNTIIIQGSEDDTPITEDQNKSGYPFEDFKFECKTINSDLYDLFLSYKIERPATLNFIENEDISFSLNSISLNPLPLDDFVIDVKEAKVEYLKNNKGDSLQRSGLKDITADQLSEHIKSKVNQNYIYNMDYRQEHNVALFNIILEFISEGKPSRLTASLEYIPNSKTLRLITLF